VQKSILILGAGQEQVPAIEAAKYLGLQVIAMDNSLDAPGAIISDSFFRCDIRNSREVIALINSNAIKLDGVFCHAVEMSVTTSLVASEFNLPGISPNAAINSTDKLKRIQKLERAGIPVAKYEFCYNFKDAVAAFNKFGGIVFLKPINLAGSRGVARCTTFDELEEFYYSALEMSPQGVLLEEVLEGLELSTESIVYEGGIHTFAIADRNYSNSKQYFPHIIEDGINFPSVISAEEKSQVLMLIEDTVKVLGIDFGAAKGDLVIVRGKPMIIEMASRTSGGWFGVGCITAATGVDPLIPLIQMHVGELPDLNKLRPTRQLACAQRYLIPSASGVLRQVERKLIEEQPTLDKLAIPQVGDFIEEVVDHSKRLGSVICADTELSQAISRCEKIIDAINLEVISL
jgi:biotin carboxylase